MMRKYQCEIRRKRIHQVRSDARFSPPSRLMQEQGFGFPSPILQIPPGALD